jgi:23S rRNA (cytosine1962-C5)-methyltransferase
VYGESDGLPGIIVDLYGEFAVIRTYIESVQVLVPWIADALHAHTDLQGILLRRAGSPVESLWGRLPPRSYTIEEHGLLFAVDLYSGQKTGFFFDQRENRLNLSSWCQGKTVLDCFCYSGAFSVYALRGGAESVTACDISGGAVDAARENLSLNGFDPDHSRLLVGDCYTLLDSFAQEKRRFDVVVLDPPSLARNRQSRRAAERAYVRLNQRALRCVRVGGLLASASCTSQVSPPAFRQALAEAARQAGRRLQILHDAGQAVDHPVPAHFPEARYLKFMLCRVLPVS